MYAICQKTNVTGDHYAIQVIMLSRLRKINLVLLFVDHTHTSTQTHRHAVDEEISEEEKGTYWREEEKGEGKGGRDVAKF